MASPSGSSSGLWTVLSQASNVAQLVGVDALGLASMVVQAALAARRHRDACRRLAQHVELVGGLLRELETDELARREATRRPLEQLGAALRRCYALVTACQGRGGFLHRLLVGARMADELRAAEQEIDMFIRLIPLIALVDTTHDRRAKDTEDVPSVTVSCSNFHTRITTRVAECSELSVQGTTLPFKAGEELEGKVDLQEQRIMYVQELVKICTRTEERCPGFKTFDFFQIVDATDNFSEERIVGTGGFGTVYKGQLTNGIMVAIKRFDEHATAFDANSELQLASLQHSNLVRLLGWCVHGTERILVYEFIDKGTLHCYIFNFADRREPLLDWSTRLNIIKGIAEGLVYLHKHSMLWLVHRDLKPKNILLDHDMNPKIADFGSARALSSDVAEERTRRVVGTSGYKAPEYASRGIYSVKTDVFSFGVLALVIISGRKNTIMDQQGDTVGSLVRDAWQLWNDGRLHELVDPMLSDKYEIADIMRCAQMALLCAQEDPADRPTMSDVIALLNFESVSLLPNPKRPSELLYGDATGKKLSTCIGQSSRTVDITITSSAPVSTRVRIIVD